jgi:hypothetical protein
MEQVWSNGRGAGLVVDGLDHTYVELRDHGHNGMYVSGGALATAGKGAEGRVNLFCGSSSRHTNNDDGVPVYGLEKNGRLLLRDIWFEGTSWAFMHGTDTGELTYNGGHIAHEPRWGNPSLLFDGFRGRVLRRRCILRHKRRDA